MSRERVPVARECAVCHEGGRGILQYAEKRRSGKWRNYLAHAECVGSEAPTTPLHRKKPKAQQVRRTTVRRKRVE